MSDSVQWSNNTCRLNKINGRFGKDIYAEWFCDQIGHDFEGKILSIGLREAFGIAKLNQLLPKSTIDVIDIFSAESWAIPNKVFKTNITQIATLKLVYSSESELKDHIFSILDSIDMTKYDKVIMNPPFKLGNKICAEALKHCSCDVICLMPLSKYKAGKLYEHVDLSTFKLVDPRLFSEATITNNLSIATLKHEKQNESFDPLEDLSFNKNYSKVYTWNKTNRDKFFTFQSLHTPLATVQKLGINKDTWFEITIRTVQDGVHKTENCHDYHWNVAKDIPDSDITLYQAFQSTSSAFLRFNKSEEKDNFCKWWYSARLSDKLIHGLNTLGGSVEPAIPQIDWDKIDQDEDWKAGDYDKAVLNAMGLEMREDGYILEKK